MDRHRLRHGPAAAAVELGQGSVRPLRNDADAVFAYARAGPRGDRFPGLANFSEAPASCAAWLLDEAGLVRPRDALREGGEVDRRAGRVIVPALGSCWLVESNQP